jgi:hypothetical protein
LRYGKDIVRLVDIGMLEEVYPFEWASLFPSFAISKKNGTIRVITDFRKLNVLLKHRKSSISYSNDWMPACSVQWKGLPLLHHWT